MYYQEQDFYDPINSIPYSVYAQFKFQCKITNFEESGSIRVLFLSGINGNDFTGKSWNSKFVIGKNFDPHDPIHRNKDTMHDTNTMFIKRSSIYKHQIQIDYSKKLNGL